MSSSVKKRETFYLAGYDPRGARHYYNLYKKEAALQSKVNGMTMDISSRKRTDKHMQSWHIKSSTGDNTTETNYHFLEWDDIIRKRWNTTTSSIFQDLFYYMKIYIFSGLIIKFGKLSPGQMAPAFFPVFYLLLTLLGAYLLGDLFFGLIVTILPSILSIGIAVLIAYLFIRLMVHIGDKIAVFWLLRIYVFCAKFVFDDMDTLDERINVFANHLANVINSSDDNDIDEILISAHSVGTIIAIPMLAQIFEKMQLPKDKLEKVSFLTLGECIPLVSFLEASHDFKASMSVLGLETNLCWFDYTSPIDGACFPFLDYYKHSGLKEKGPEYLSPRFHTLYSKENYIKIKKDKYLIHFLYLMSTDLSGIYDYYKMTAGHRRLSSF